jgi:hypothetical protein
MTLKSRRRNVKSIQLLLPLFQPNLVPMYQLLPRHIIAPGDHFQGRLFKRLDLNRHELQVRSIPLLLRIPDISVTRNPLPLLGKRMGVPVLDKATHTPPRKEAFFEIPACAEFAVYVDFPA